MQGFRTSTNDVPACSRCGEPLVPGEPFCPGCGARVGASCRQCGDSLVPGKPFCPTCGTPLAGIEDAPTTPVALTAPPVGPMRHQTTLPVPPASQAPATAAAPEVAMASRRSGRRAPLVAALGGLILVASVAYGAALTLLPHSGSPPTLPFGLAPAPSTAVATVAPISSTPLVQGTSTPAAQDTPTVSAQATVTPPGAGTTAATSVWNQQTSGTSDDLLGMACPSPSTCVAVGGYGTILRTMDGGNAWSSQTNSIGVDLLDVACPSPSTCVAVGAGGTTLRTTDGGNTWSSQTTDMTSDDNLNSVACPSPSACVAVGTRGMILRTSNAGSP